jgi:hypothetical protein
MIHAIDAALVIGVATTGLNLGDLFLRDTQRERFQQAMEQLTLWLDYRRPMSWIASVPESTTLFALGIFLVVGSLAWMLMTSDTISNFWREFSVFLYIQAIGSLFLIVFRRDARDLLSALVADPTLPAIITRSSARIGRAILTQSAWYAAYGAAMLVAVVFPVFALVNLWLVWLLFVRFRAEWMDWQIALPAGVLAIGFAVLLTGAELSLVAARAVSWRIVEYSKGAWAAVIVVGTVALGVAKLVFGL